MCRYIHIHIHIYIYIYIYKDKERQAASNKETEIDLFQANTHSSTFICTIKQEEKLGKYLSVSPPVYFEVEVYIHPEVVPAPPRGTILGRSVVLLWVSFKRIDACSEVSAALPP